MLENQDQNMFRLGVGYCSCWYKSRFKNIQAVERRAWFL